MDDQYHARMRDQHNTRNLLLGTAAVIVIIMICLFFADNLFPKCNSLEADNLAFVDKIRTLQDKIRLYEQVSSASNNGNQTQLQRLCMRSEIQMVFKRTGESQQDQRDQQLLSAQLLIQQLKKVEQVNKQQIRKAGADIEKLRSQLNLKEQQVVKATNLSLAMKKKVAQLQNTVDSYEKQIVQFQNKLKIQSQPNQAAGFLFLCLCVFVLLTICLCCQKCRLQRKLRAREKSCTIF